MGLKNLAGTAALLAAGALPTVALAANGSLLTSNGAAASGMGGVSIALPQDAVVAADNPAGMAFVGTRLDVYGALILSSSVSSLGFPQNEHISSVIAPVIGFGYNRELDPQWTVGVSVTGAGLSADYGERVLPVPGAGRAQAKLVVINTSPTVTYKPTENLSLGASIVFGLQRFSASGVVVGGPGGVPLALPTHGDSWATGVSAAFGVLWRPHPMLNLGASYFTETKFSSLSGYKNDLFAASGGHLNQPAKYGVGVALKPTDQLTLGFDYVKILWSQAAAYNDPVSFNWHDQDVYRLGIAYRMNDKLTVRAGYNQASSHVDSEHTLANFYANVVNNRAYTIGLTYELSNAGSIVAAFEHEIPRTLRGTGISTGTNLSTEFQVLTVGYSHKF